MAFRYRSPHLVFFKDSVDDIDVLKLGASIRYSDFFLDKGVNINFVSQKSNSFILEHMKEELKMRY